VAFARCPQSACTLSRMIQAARSGKQNIVEGSMAACDLEKDPRSS
jgi:hypothetical protein